MQSQDERDVAGLAARKERDSASKDFAGEEITGRYEGEELELRRSERPDPERIGRLEKKHDELKQDVGKKHDELKGDIKEVRDDVKTLSTSVGNLRAEVSGATGKLDGQTGVLNQMLSLVKKTADRDHVTYTTKLEVDKAHELAQLEVNKEQQLAVIEVTKEEKVDGVKAKGDRRRRNLEILGLVASGAGVVELLHRLGVL